FLKNSALSPVHIMMCLTKDEEPPSLPLKVAGAPNTSVIGLGHKGRYVGVVGIWKTAKGIEQKYQLVAMGPEFATESGKEQLKRVETLHEKYAEDVRDGNYLARYPRGSHRIQAVVKEAKYVGSQRCAECHESAFNIWQKSAHAHAFDTLVKDKNPSLRQF